MTCSSTDMVRWLSEDDGDDEDPNTGGSLLLKPLSQVGVNY